MTFLPLMNAKPIGTGIDLLGRLKILIAGIAILCQIGIDLCLKKLY